VYVPGSPTLVLAHGWGVGPFVWDRLARLLAGRWRSVPIAVPGLGFSQDATPGPSWTLAAAIDDLARYVAEEGPGPVIVIGSSVSGSAAIALASRPPGNLAAVIAIGAAARFLRADDYPMGMTFEEATGLVEAIRTDPVGMFSQVGPTAFWNDDDAEAAARTGTEILSEVRACGTPERIADSYEETLSTDIRSVLGEVSVPTLLIHGARDGIAPPAAGEFLAQRIPGSRLQVVPGAGHLPHATSSESTARAVATFIDELWGSRG
jgi:pimeloyl-ACP methyl ester carboxylesterase